MKKNTKILPANDPIFPKGKKTIPVSAPYIGAGEIKYVTEAVKSGWVSSQGEFIDKFEKQFARKVSKTKYAIAVSSGTNALHLALSLIGVKPGDEVIIPTFTMIATANAVSYLGARPVLVDADPNSWNMDVTKIERKITKRTKAIIPVHVYGLPCDMDPVKKIARKHNLWVVEDAAEAHGAEYKGKRVGGFGDVGAFSFYANKLITTGEGGMITTNNSQIAKKAHLLRGHAVSSRIHFWHEYLGYGYRMTNLQAALGLGQIEQFDRFVRKRREDASFYKKLLKDVGGITFPIDPVGYKNIFWMFAILIEEEFGISRDQLRSFLAKKGIETRTFFIPIHLQPNYSELIRSEKFPVSEELCRKGLYLPSSNTITKREISLVAKAIIEAKKEGR